MSPSSLEPELLSPRWGPLTSRFAPHRMLHICDRFLSVGARSRRPVLRALILHVMIISRGCYSPGSRVQSVPKVNGDNGPKNRPEGQDPSHLQRSLCPSGEAVPCRLGSSFRAVTPFLWTPRKAIFSLQNMDRKNFLPPEAA